MGEEAEEARPRRPRWYCWVLLVALLLVQLRVLSSCYRTYREYCRLCGTIRYYNAVEPIPGFWRHRWEYRPTPLSEIIEPLMPGGVCSHVWVPVDDEPVFDLHRLGRWHGGERRHRTAFSAMHCSYALFCYWLVTPFSGHASVVERDPELALRLAEIFLWPAIGWEDRPYIEMLLDWDTGIGHEPPTEENLNRWREMVGLPPRNEGDRPHDDP